MPYKDPEKSVYKVRKERGLCTRCGINKPGPKRTMCLKCQKEWSDYTKERRKSASPEKKSEKRGYDEQWRKDHPEMVKAQSKRAYTNKRIKYPEKTRQQSTNGSRKWRKAHPEESRMYSRNWRKSHPTEMKGLTNAWRDTHPEETKAGRRRSYKNNREKSIARSRNRQISNQHRTPPWAESIMRGFMPKMMKLRKRLEGVTDKKYHIDHVIPLNGKLVSGLHVPWNIRVIPAVENISKGNKFEPLKITYGSPEPIKV